jgi:hypothetical protein
MIVSSSYSEGPIQADGRRYVSEVHTDSNGRTYAYEWLGDQDAAIVVQARAEALSADLAKKAAAEAVVLGTKAPLTHLEFRRLFTQDELEAVDELNATFESRAFDADPDVSNMLKRKVRTAIKTYETSSYVNLTDPATARGLGLYVMLGILTSQRMGEILNG